MDSLSVNISTYRIFIVFNITIKYSNIDLNYLHYLLYILKYIQQERLPVREVKAGTSGGRDHDVRRRQTFARVRFKVSGGGTSREK